VNLSLLRLISFPYDLSVTLCAAYFSTK